MQKVQRFTPSYEDLDRYNCTIEERENTNPYIDMGGVKSMQGVDYGEILKQKNEEEADVIIWDMAETMILVFTKQSLSTIADPHRPSHEISYYPGELNTRAADVVLINKVNTAEKRNIELVRKNVKDVRIQMQRL